MTLCQRKKHIYGRCAFLCSVRMGKTSYEVKEKENEKANKKSRRIRRLFLSFKIIAAFVAVIKAFFSYDPPRDEVVFLSKYGAKYSNPPVDAD